MNKAFRHIIFASVLLFLVAGCGLSTSSEPEIEQEQTLAPNAAQLQARRATDVPVQTEEPSESETEVAVAQATENPTTPVEDEAEPSEVATEPVEALTAAPTERLETAATTATAPVNEEPEAAVTAAPTESSASEEGPVETDEPSEAATTAPVAYDSDIVIDQIWYIFEEIGEESVVVQCWFFVDNTSDSPVSDLRLALPEIAQDVSVGSGFSLEDNVIVAQDAIPGGTDNNLVIVSYQLEREDLATVNFSLDYPVDSLNVYTPVSLRPQQEVPELEYLDIRLIRTLGDFLVFESPEAILAGEEIQFSVQASDQIRLAEDVNTATVTVSVSNLTEGAEVPEGLEMTLISFAFQDNQLTQIFDQTLPIDPESLSATFESVPFDETGLIEAQVEYNDITFWTRIDGAEVEGDTVEDQVRLYEPTDDASVLSLNSVWYVVDAVTGEGLAEYFHYYFFENTSDRVYVGGGAGEGVIRIPLPASTRGASIPQDLGSMVTVDTSGEVATLVDNRVVFPDRDHVVAARFITQYDGSSTMNHALPFDAEEVTVYTSQSRFLGFEANDFESLGVESIPQLGSYNAYTRSNVAADSPIQFTISDTEQTPQFDPTTGSTSSSRASSVSGEEDESFLVENRMLILGLGILIVIFGGIFLAYDLQKERIRAQTTIATANVNQNQPQNKRNTGASTRMSDLQQSLIAEIAELDEAFENGDISEDEYRAERKRLKNELMSLMD